MGVRYIMKFIAILLLLLGLITGFVGVGFYSSNLASDSLSKSKKIENIFSYASEKINKYHSEHEHYPTQETFKSWESELSVFGLYGEILEYKTSEYPKELIKFFDVPVQPSYALIVWRGEWNEYYASWANKSSLPKKINDYYFTGYKIGDFIFTSILSLISLLISFYVYRKNT